jgi:hypothetical protein
MIKNSEQIANPDSFRIRKSANFLCVLVRKSQIRKFVLINPQIANPQISLVSQSANSKPASLQGKKQCFRSKPHWLAPNIFFTFVDVRLF